MKQKQGHPRFVVLVIMVVLIVAGLWMMWLAISTPDAEGACRPGEPCWGNETPVYRGTPQGYPPPPTTCEPYPPPYPNPGSGIICPTYGSPPVSVMHDLPAISRSNSVFISWAGFPSPSNWIVYYDVRYRFNDTSWGYLLGRPKSWPWATVELTEDGLYEFEVRATDNEGNVEPFLGVPEASIYVDAEAPFIEPDMFLPAVIKLAD
jgi:hypothetical protein